MVMDETVADESAVWFGDALMTVRVDGGVTGGSVSVVEARLPAGYSTPAHTHFREDEIFVVLEGRIRCRQEGHEFVAGPGDVVHRPLGQPHAYRVESDGARALLVFAPAGHERFYLEAGVPAYGTSEPPVAEYSAEEAAAMAERFGYEVVGPRLEA